jgi:hypothetical protein
MFPGDGGGVASAAAPARRANIVILYADDLGYGDVHRYNHDRGRIPMPHIDMARRHRDTVHGWAFIVQRLFAVTLRAADLTVSLADPTAGGHCGHVGQSAHRPRPSHDRGPREATRLPDRGHRQVASRLGTALLRMSVPRNWRRAGISPAARSAATKAGRGGETACPSSCVSRA